MVCVTLYLLLVSSNIDNVQSLLHGKCLQSPEFSALLTLLFGSGVKCRAQVILRGSELA